MAENVMGGFQKTHLDSKRRVTFPVHVLEEAEMRDATDLVMRIERPGRILLEDPDVLMEDLQEKFAAAMEESATDADAVIDSLFADRASDTSLS